MRPLRFADYYRAYRARSRDPEWAGVQEHFRHHGDGVLAIQRLTRVWTNNFGLRPVDAFRGRIVHESWPAERIGDLLNLLAGTPHRSGDANRLITEERPRFTEFPLVVVRTQGREFLIDGRRRANLWRWESGAFPVSVIEVAPRTRA